jgi:crotonobetainyl-CoA:carnitine CoA-transferase CaiB-like acyl-CoA transferase
VGPLRGIKVLDLSRVLAGPWAGQCLADFGAEVIKVEKPGSGDDTRGWGPPWFDTGSGQGESAYYLSANRGKESVAVDFTLPEGADIVRQLANEADVLIENFKVGGLQKYGLDFASLIALNPKLVYCSITGFGQTGPMKDLPGYDAMIQAQGGIMSLTGVPEGEAGAGPQKIGVAVADLMTGMYAVSAILAALLHVKNTGVGQHIDLSLLDTQVAWLANQSMNYLIGGVVPQRLGTAHPNIVPYQSFKTADGYLMLAVGNDEQFARFCKAANNPSVAQDGRFLSNAMRVQNRAELVRLCQAWLLTQTTQQWLAVLSRANVPAGPINDLAQVFDHPQVQARGLQFELPHGCGKKVSQVKNPVRFSETPICYERAPPSLGEHTIDVLKSLNLNDSDIEKLRQAGVFRSSDSA